MILRTGILCMLMFLLGGCMQTDVKEEAEIPGPVNRSTGVQISSRNNFIILRRGKDIQKICSRFEQDRFHFFSATGAPIVYAEAVNPSGNNALLRIDLPGKNFPLNETNIREVSLSAKLNGKQVQIVKILAVRLDGLMLAVEYRTNDGKTDKAMYQVETGNILPFLRMQGKRK